MPYHYFNTSILDNHSGDQICDNVTNSDDVNNGTRVNITCTDINDDDFATNFTIDFITNFYLTFAAHYVPELCDDLSSNNTLIEAETVILGVPTDNISIISLQLTSLPLMMCSSFMPCGPNAWFGRNFLMATRAMTIIPTSPIYLISN